MSTIEVFQPKLGSNKAFWKVVTPINKFVVCGGIEIIAVHPEDSVIINCGDRLIELLEFAPYDVNNPNDSGWRYSSEK